VSATAHGAQQQQLQLRVHAQLRDELARLQQAVGQVDDAGTAAHARSYLNQMAMRQNYWTLGSFCAAYCRVLATHHTIEDEAWFPALRDAEPDLAPVIDRLEAEHVTIAGMLDGLDRALVAMVAEPAQIERVRRAVDELAEALLAHLAYEEEHLLDAIGRTPIDG
jgi:hypothetical protein